ncbi:MAG TPA: transaldolase family protein [Polyangiaceae bacterium]|jgi:transaldolase|nr:transaldolase family protein [Polyangiaceae bacterium]
MALFIDSSEPKEIKDLYAWGVLSGVTTNPLIIAREAPDANLAERIREILAVSWGDVSVELTTESESAMLDEALQYHAWNPERITIKVPFSETGLRVLHQLVKRGIKTNVTCLMAMNQAYLAALAGATYVSIFSGRVRDMGYDVRPVISATRALLDREGLVSKIIVGSMRHMMDVNEALDAGAHIPTVVPPILRKMVWNPRTIETIAEFNDAWRNRGNAKKR